MGQEKHLRDEAEASWDRKAVAEDIRCSICKSHIPYGERDIYFQTKMCGYCAKEAQKTD